jgi:NRPS condensation-like uncharacterized protein
MLPAELADVALIGSAPRLGDLSIHAAVDLRRRFARAELERAAEATVRAFPVLGRRYEARFWRDQWVPASGPLSDVVHVNDAPADLEAETLAWARRRIVQERERPFRIVSLGRPQGSRLLLSVLHTAVDGAGVAAVAHVFAAHLYGVMPSLPVDARRGVGHALERLRWVHAPALLRDIASAFVQPVRMRRGGKRARPYALDPAAPASARRLVVSAAELARMRAACGGIASVNDVLVAALARMAASRSTNTDGIVPVVYTMDLRRYGEAPRLTAANISSILSVLVPRRATVSLASSLAAVAELTGAQRRGLDGPAFILGPTLLALGMPHAWLRRLVPHLHPLLVDLAVDRGLVVTNVGRIDEGLTPFGGDIEGIRLLGPHIEGIGIPIVVAFGFEGRLHLELLGPPGLAEAALDEFRAELCAALDLPPRDEAPKSTRDEHARDVSLGVPSG